MNISMFRVLAIKLALSFLVYALSFDLFFDVEFSTITTFALLTTIISYFVGDLIVLPKLGNRKAALIDFFTVYLIVWVFGNVLLQQYELIAWGSIFAATLTFAAEVVLHSMIYRQEIQQPSTTQQRRKMITSPRVAFSTEFAEETEPLKNEKKE